MTNLEETQTLLLERIKELAETTDLAIVHAQTIKELAHAVHVLGEPLYVMDAKAVPE